MGVLERGQLSYFGKASRLVKTPIVYLYSGGRSGSDSPLNLTGEAELSIQLKRYANVRQPKGRVIDRVRRRTCFRGETAPPGHNESKTGDHAD